MKTRIITATVGFFILLPCLIFVNLPLLDIFLMLCSALAVFEMVRCLKLMKNLAVLIPSLVIGFITPLFANIIKVDYVKCIVFISAFYFLYMMTISIFSKGKLEVSTAAMCAALVIYIIVGFSAILFVRGLVVVGDNGEVTSRIGLFMYLAIMFAAWFPDAGAYFVGIKYGKTKLIPDVSPKKTVEGLLGGFGTNLIVFLIYSLIIRFVFNAPINILFMVLLSIPLTFVSVVGDLLASLIKRHYNIKDYGNLLPGHGGILDRFDSVLATSIVTFVILMFIYTPGV